MKRINDPYYFKVTTRNYVMITALLFSVLINISCMHFGYSNISFVLWLPLLVIFSLTSMYCRNSKGDIINALNKDNDTPPAPTPPPAPPPDPEPPPTPTPPPAPASLRDVFVANFNQSQSLYKDFQVSSNSFTSVTDPATDLGNSVAVEMADLDNDGDMDIVVANDNGQHKVYVNQGNARFSVMNLTTPVQSGTTIVDVAVGTIDAGSTPDLVFIERDTRTQRCHGSSNTLPSGQRTRAYIRLNLSAGGGISFGASSTHTSAKAEAFRHEDIELVNIDSDAELELLAVSSSRSQLISALGVANTSNCSAASSSYPGFPIDRTPGGTSGQLKVYQNMTMGSTFNFALASRGSSSLNQNIDNAMGLAAADLDGDQDNDIFVAVGGAANQVRLNNGSGDFSTSGTITSAPSRDSRSVRLADLDGDRDIDAFVVNNGAQNSVCLNNGSATFTCSNASSDTNDSQDVFLADLDNDGDIDAFVVNDGQKNRVYLNVGNATFTAVDADSRARDSRAVAIDHLD